MKFQIGDKIILLHSNEEGEIIDIINKEKSQPKKRVDGLWLTFLPVFEVDEFGDEFVKELKLHLINNTHLGYQFRYTLNYFGKDEFELKNQIHTFEDFYLHDVAFEDLNDNPSFDFDFSLITPDKKKAEHIETSIKARPKNIFLKIEEIKKKNEPTFSYKLFDEYPEKMAEEKIETSPASLRESNLYEASEARSRLEPAKHEVDLHIEKL